MAIKKTYPFISQKQRMPLESRGKMRIHLMEKNEPVEEEMQEKDEAKSLLEQIIRDLPVGRQEEQENYCKQP